MSDPKRLLHTRELGELGKSALGAAVELEPPPGARERVWTDLGAKLPFAGDAAADLPSEAGGGSLGGAASGAAAGGAAAAGGGAAAGGAAVTGTASALGVTLAKVTGGLVALGAMATGGAVATGMFDASPPPLPAASASAPPSAPNVSTSGVIERRPAAASPPEPQSPTETATESISAGTKVPTPMATAKPSEPAANERSRAGLDATQAPPSVASFPPVSEEAGPAGKPVRPDLTAAAREESRLVGAAREALRAGDAGRALELLTDARRRFPGGVLGQERAALGIEALMQSGARAEAAESARRFLAAFPNSPHAARVRALVAASPTP